ncbi:MAG: DNA cytosine methyltransferase [Bacteroidales bacterium]|nr:DNA cytosine methyltransferase [Bacteroidales bacterium]
MMQRIPYNQQLDLINYSIKSKVPLDELLKEKGFTYDSLGYSDNARLEDFTFPEFISIEKRQKKSNGIPCISFFSGAGGLDTGFRYAGFDNIIDVEINELFCNTLRVNGAKRVLGPPYSPGDIQNYESIIAKLEEEGVPRNFPGVFHGGPPCQSFSIAANQRFSKDGDNFKRTGFSHEKYGNLLFCYINIIVHFMPEVFLIENVDGLLTIDGGKQVRNACSILRDAGYNVTPPAIVNAADFGIPQKRLRAIIVGSRRGTIELPAPNPAHIPSGCVFREPIVNDDSHLVRNHKAESIKRYMELAFGQRDKLGRVDRIDPMLPSKTIIAGGTSGGGRSHLHPFVPRTMTVRECARLQTFPDGYIFTGSMARRFTQVGNAVPPILGFEMACAIYNSIYS